MAGNVWELVGCPDQSELCVLRGGSFVNGDQVVRSDLHLGGFRERTGHMISAFAARWSVQARIGNRVYAILSLP